MSRESRPVTRSRLAICELRSEKIKAVLYKLSNADCCNKTNDKQDCNCGKLGSWICALQSECRLHSVQSYRVCISLLARIFLTSLHAKMLPRLKFPFRPYLIFCIELRSFPRYQGCHYAPHHSYTSLHREADPVSYRACGSR